MIMGEANRRYKTFDERQAAAAVDAQRVAASLHSQLQAMPDAERQKTLLALRAGRLQPTPRHRARWPLIAIALIAMTAAGCASMDLPTRTSTVSNNAATPVPIACLTAQDVPPLPKPTPLDVDRATPKQKASAQEADLLALEIWVKDVLPRLQQCMKVQP